MVEFSRNDAQGGHALNERSSVRPFCAPVRPCGQCFYRTRIVLPTVRRRVYYPEARLDRTVHRIRGSPQVKHTQELKVPEPTSRDRSKRVLKVAVIAVVIIEAMAIVPLVIHLANK
jgi:hypothetical protein